MALVLLGAVGLVASAIVPSLPALLAFLPARVFAGEVWRIVTWPVTEGVSLWSLLTLVILWYFGSQLEATVGKIPMAKLYVGAWAAMTAAAAFVGILAPNAVALIGLDQIQFAILLLWIAEYPTRPFFFRIPAWVIGAVLLGIQLLGWIAARAWGTVVAELLGLFGVAVAARGVGLLSSYSWIPGGRSSRRPSSRSSSRGKPGGSRPARGERRRMADEQRLDELLAKISAQGLHSLSKGERAELDKLRERRQRHR